MRYVTLGLSFILAAGLASLMFYAGGEDTYYGSDVSRWEHAGRWGATPLVVGAMAISGATVIGLLISAFAPAAGLGRVVLPTAALSGLMLIMAWFFLTAGH